MEIKTNKLTPELFLKLYTSVGWQPPTMDQVAVALKNTLVTFVAYEDNEPIGMVRLIGDGGMSFYVKDFAIVPSKQGDGVGSCLMEAMESYIKEIIKKEWAVSLELISTKEAVLFYEKHGFEQRPCEWDGPGMFKMIR